MTTKKRKNYPSDKYGEDLPKIYLLRHGEKTRDGKDLTKFGRRQVKFLGKKLSRIKFDKFISSDLGRCVKTAEILQKYVGLEIRYDESLREIRDYLQNTKKFKEDYQKVKRFVSILRKERGNILLVGSGNVNRLILSLFLDLDPKRSKFLQYPSGLNVIEKYSSKKDFEIVTVNNTDHLPLKYRKRQGY